MTHNGHSTRRWLPWIASAGVSVGIFAYLLSQIDPTEILLTARRLPARPLIIYAGLVLGGVVARALRFWVLLGRNIGLGLLVGIVFARNLFVDLLPARVGELSYVYLLSRRGHRQAEEGLATLVLSVLFDVVALAPLLILGLVVIGRGEALPTTALVAASATLAAVAYGAILAAEPVSRFLARNLERKSESPLLRNVAARLAVLADALADARARRVFAPVLALSLAVRLCKFGSYYFLVVGIVAALGMTGTLQFFRVFLGTVAAELAAALPIHGIAGFGTFEAAWALAFVHLGFTREHAIVTGILAHALSQLFEYSLGACALLWLMRPQRDRGQRAVLESDETRPSALP